MYASSCMLHDMAHSLPVPETYGRVRFPRLVRQQSTCPYSWLSLMVYFRNSSTDIQCELLPIWSWPCLIVPPQCTGRVDTRLPRNQEVIYLFFISTIYTLFIPIALRFNGSNYGHALAAVSMTVRILHPHMLPDPN